MSEKVIHSSSIALRVRTIIEEASFQILLISPYFDPWKSLHKSILDAVKRGVKCTIIIRSNETIKENVKEIILEFINAGVKIRESERLHAKLYLSEKSIILTSMNLLESSATDSIEVGMEFTDDSENSRLLRKQADDIFDHSKDSRFTSIPPQPTLSNSGDTSFHFDGSSSSSTSFSTPFTAKKSCDLKESLLPSSPSMKTSDTISFEMFLEGYDVYEIAKIRSFREQTIVEHLIKNMPHEAITFDKFMTLDIYNSIKDVFVLYGTGITLKTAKSHLPNTITYDQIKIAKALSFT